MRPGESAPASSRSGAVGDGGGRSSGVGGGGDGSGGGGGSSTGGVTWCPGPDFVDEFPVSQLAALRAVAVSGINLESEQAEVAGMHSFAHLAIRLGMRDVMQSIAQVLSTMCVCRSGAPWSFDVPPRLRARAGVRLSSFSACCGIFALRGTSLMCTRAGPLYREG